MNARDTILGQLRESLRSAPAAALPQITNDFPSGNGLQQRFVNAVSEANGQVVVASVEAKPSIEALDVYVHANRLFSQIPGLSKPSVALDSMVSGHECANLELSIARGQLGVAESGAIWVTGKGLAQRAALFLAQHLLLILDAEHIVSNLHAAYSRLDVTTDPFGCFISGPSKTADIEQALVVGAHGPRSLTVVLLTAPAPSQQ